MSKIIECVPNFSEGKDQIKINKIVDSISSIKGVFILDVDPGEDTNRTVLTMVGDPDSILEAAYKGIKTASEIIDMTNHSGTHPRIGATDVCPFIPIQDVSIEECINLAEKLAQKVGDKLNIPVYLYEKSAKLKERTKLPNIRNGEYEGLSEKLLDSKWKPDYGPDKLINKAGATIIGCRDFLIAYNINLNTRDHRIATDIAFELREAGRSKRIPNPRSKNLLDGEIVRNEDGRAIKIPGLFKDVKAIGWYVDSYKRAQISINFNNYKESSVHHVYEKACDLAIERGVRVTGSELVGLVPLDAILSAGIYFLRKQGRSLGVPEEDVIECAVQTLGLNDVTKFLPNEKIIDYVVDRDKNNLIDYGFFNELSRNSPAPGGGSVSALAGALGASLSSMVASLTHEKKGNIDLKPEMDQIGVDSQKFLKRLLFLIDEDTQAFNNVIASNKLPVDNKKDLEHKIKEIENSNKYAADIPLETAKLCLQVIKLSRKLIKTGNPNLVTDASVAAEVAAAGVKGACLNVMINLKEINDSSYKSGKSKEVAEILREVDKIKKETFDQTIKVINNL